MMIVRKTSTILLLVLAFGLTSCSKDKPAPAEKTEAIPSKPGTNKITTEPAEISPMELMKKNTLAAKELKDRFNLKSVIVSLNNKGDYDGIAISESTISDELAKLISESENLSKWLDLQYCTITDEQIGKFSNLKALNRIQITGTNISGSSLRMLEEFESLEELNLSSCFNLTDDNLPIVKGLSEFSILGCSKITDASVPKLGSMTKLKSLNIIETGISSKGIADLKKLLPKCNIISG